ncbi:FAD-dependent oxidoreductase [Salinispora arenicola]|uniref:FAD-dependent oxidoreductase n=1 Tax=Salinispora arenicola TaxID=168697 RepID=UPI003F5CF024
MRLSVLDEKWLTGATGGLGGGSERGAYTQFLHLWALCNHNADQYYGINTYRPASGMTSLAQAILTEAAADVRLNSPVRSIIDTGREVVVRTRTGASYSAASVVVAVPVNVWNSIEFSPGLTVERRRASNQTFGVPTAQKLWLRLRTSLGNTYVHTPEGYPIHTLVPIKQLADSQLMVGFSGDQRLDVNNVAQVERAVRLVVPDATVSPSGASTGVRTRTRWVAGRSADPPVDRATERRSASAWPNLVRHQRHRQRVERLRGRGDGVRAARGRTGGALRIEVTLVQPALPVPTAPHGEAVEA